MGGVVKDFHFIIRVIKSCENDSHYQSTYRLIDNFKVKYYGHCYVDRFLSYIYYIIRSYEKMD